MKNTSEIQEVSGIYIYPQEYFAPKDVDTKKLKITKNTRSIHHYDASWAEWYDKAAGERGPKLLKISGITSKNGRNDAKRLNIRIVTVSNDDKPKNRKTQRRADLRRRMVCKSLPVKE